MKGRLLGSGLAIALVASSIACGPSQAPVYVEDVVLPSPGGAALAGIPPVDAVALAAIATRVPELGADTPGDVAGGDAEPEPDGRGERAAAAPLDDGTTREAQGPRRVRVVAGTGFSYAVPEEWEELDPSTLGSPMLMFAQRADVPTDGFMTNVNVAVEPWEGEDAAYGAANVAELAKISVVEAQRPARLGARPALDVEAYWQNHGGVPYRTLQRYVAGEGAGLVLTCAAAATAFERELAQCEAIVGSFRLE